MASSYYGDQSYEAFYATGPSQETRHNGRTGKKQSRSDSGLTPIPINHHRDHSAAANVILKTISDNKKHTIEKSAIEGKKGEAGKGGKSTDKILKRMHGGSRASTWRIPKKPRTIPEPTVNLDSQNPMYLLLIEGNFPRGVNRQDYLSNIYYHGDAELLPSIGRAFDVLPHTRMAAGGWLVIPSNNSSATLDDQSDWSGQRIRFASPKAATTKSVYHFRVSPTTDTLGSLTVAAFSGFSTSDEFENGAQAFTQKILELNKQQEWSKPVADLPPFRLDGTHYCAGGLTIAAKIIPERCPKYYLKIGICKASKEIVCVECTCSVSYH
jgi:hypothetical protein